MTAGGASALRATEPLVTIGVPVYNGADYLTLAIDSLLAQTYRNVELLISDNASTDGSSEVCAAYAQRDARVRYIRQAHNIGGVENHNFVVEQARGEFFMWGSSDDLWEPSYVQRCAQVLIEDPKVVLAYSINTKIDENGQSIGAYPQALQLDTDDVVARFGQLTQIDNPIEPFYGLMRRSALQASARLPLHPGFDRFVLAELGLKGRFRQLPEPLYIRRIHGNQSTKAYRSLRSRYRWVNPANKDRRFVWPHFAYLRLFLGVVMRSAPGPRATMGCLLHLAKWCNWHRRELWEDLTGAE